MRAYHFLIAGGGTQDATTEKSLGYPAFAKRPLHYLASRGNAAGAHLGSRTVMTDTTGTTHYAYDLVGRLTSVTTPGGEVVEYSYNDAG